MEDAIITAIVFTGIYQIIKVFTDFSLKKRIIASGHIEKAGIMDMPGDKEESGYATLKWGLVALFAGIGLLIIALIEQNEDYILMRGNHGYLPISIELIAISLGFLVYFVITRFRNTAKKQ